MLRLHHLVTVPLITFLLLNGAVSYAGSPASMPELTKKEIRAVDSFIGSQVRIRSHKYLSLNSLEYRDARQYIVGNLNGENALVVRYTLEESNNWTLYLAVFRKSSMQHIAHDRVGGKGYRSVDLNGIANGGIKLNVLYYSPYDGLCCPSVPGTSLYSITGNSLREDEVRVDCTQWKAPERP